MAMTAQPTGARWLTRPGSFRTGVMQASMAMVSVRPAAWLRASG